MVDVEMKPLVVEEAQQVVELSLAETEERAETEPAAGVLETHLIVRVRVEVVDQDFLLQTAPRPPTLEPPDLMSRH